MPPLLSAAAPPAVVRSRVAVPLVAGLLVATVVLLAVWWPGGVALGVAAGLFAVLAVGRRLDDAAAPATDEELERDLGVAPAVDEDGVRAELARLRADLGDDYRDFGRAARLVVSTQYASAARLQRELHVPYSRARRLLAGLETERFVGPATGSLPRRVLLPKERLPEVERLFSDA